MEFVSEPFNIARQKAFTSFYNTLDKLYGRKDITEKEFKSKWQENLEKETNILADGWYNPPPNGMTVLFGDRVSFDTLRDNKNWASEKTINWKEDLIYVYCSPIDKKSGIIGDMSLTIEKLNKIVQNINSFNIEFRNLNNFDNETLYIEPYNKDNLMNLKSIFDEELKPYRLEKRLKRIYRPHITLCTNNELSSAYKIANKEFSTFNRNNQVYMVL